MSIFILLLAIAAWGAVHSFLASLSVKAALLGWLGPSPMRFYRLAYNIFSVLSLAPIAWLIFILPDRPLYRVPAPWSYLMLMGQGAAALLLLTGVLQTDTLAFIGLRQVFKGERASSLVITGLYRYVRHPLYTAGLLMLWLIPSVSANIFAVMLSFTAYILVGAWFEERKLLREFGPAYAEYRRIIPMLFPIFWAKK